MKKFILATIILLSMLLISCTDTASLNKKAIDACIDQGGVPIISLQKFDGYSPYAVMTDCKFKDEKTKENLK